MYKNQPNETDIANCDALLAKLRFKTSTKELERLACFTSNMFRFQFREPLSYEQTDAFLSFLGSGERMCRLDPKDFCQWFQGQGIAFKLKFHWNWPNGIWINLIGYHIARQLRKEMKKQGA